MRQTWCRSIVDFLGAVISLHILMRTPFSVLEPPCKLQKKQTKKNIFLFEVETSTDKVGSRCIFNLLTYLYTVNSNIIEYKLRVAVFFFLSKWMKCKCDSQMIQSLIWPVQWGPGMSWQAVNLKLQPNQFLPSLCYFATQQGQHNNWLCPFSPSVWHLHSLSLSLCEESLN